MRLVRTAGVLLVSVCVMLGAPTAGARPHQGFRPTCRSGRTLFRHGLIRAFKVTFYDAVDHGQHQELLVCLARSRRPIVVYDPGPFNYVHGRGFRLLGTRLGFLVHDQGFDNGSETDVGWIDLRTGAVRFGLVNAGENAGPGDPLLPEDAVAYAFAPDGAAAVIAGSSCQVVALLPVRSKPQHGFYGLGPPAILFAAPTGDLDRGSLVVTLTQVSWRTLAGVPMTTSRSAGTPIARSQTGGC